MIHVHSWTRTHVASEEEARTQGHIIHHVIVFRSFWYGTVVLCWCVVWIPIYA